MVVMDLEMISQGEPESPFQAEQQQPKTTAFSSLGRQSSIYSLTLDEFQSTLCENGKSFGSMNMDEFLNSIWTAEENQAQAHAQVTSTMAPTNYTSPACTTIQLPLGEGNPAVDPEGIAKQPSLPREGSATLSPLLCQKTVDQVWAEIHKSEVEQQHNNSSNVQNSDSTQQRQLTFSEMTLEDFLIRAGIVREQCQPPQLPQQQPPYDGIYQNINNTVVGPSFVSRPIVNLGVVSGGGPAVNTTAYQVVPRSSVGEASAHQGSMKRGEGGLLQQTTEAFYDERRGNDSRGGYAQVQGLRMASPVSPLSSDGLCANQLDVANQCGMDMRGGRKRFIDGPVEKVVERRQRRMIKNRESAARSRARKQAYTVELEAELNQLKEENAHLKQALAEMERKRSRQQFEDAKMNAQTKAEKANKKLRIIRRSSSCPC